MPAPFDVAISSPVQDAVVREIAQEFEALGAAVSIEERDLRPQASFDLFVGALVVLITRKYFETLMSEAGKDHYQSAKKLIARLLRARKRYELTRVVSSRTPNKPQIPDLKTFSVTFAEEPGAVVKFAFTGETNDKDEEQSLEQLFDLLEAYCRNTDDPRVEVLKTLIATGPGAWRYVLVYDDNSHQWIPINLISALLPLAKINSSDAAKPEM